MKQNTHTPYKVGINDKLYRKLTLPSGNAKKKTEI